MNAQKLENTYLNNVGDIQFDPKIDDPEFKICNPDTSFQYYNFSKGFQYTGEKYQIQKEWNEKYPAIISKLKETGYITVRFLVNCDGKTGLFRIQEMDKNYIKISFSQDFVNTILKFIKELDGWVINEYNGQKVDYFQYLTFKIENGVVKEILP
ncbi:hypothetical protein KB553_10015 [Chryseobacterium rhizoplanae]|uniref:hypothetical protein n=1 Tax=Chryseobacterium rhizoplanae TaxID=1609531 RepID=UPI001CE25F2F|nr:hypothetical protein [Chryseobacterium rhizoplanae]UCA61833.1 hypothetical protein KB553_10015 [Chryseobacterium rhizoplanae]